jgi:hypothetical protein
MEHNLLHTLGRQNSDSQIVDMNLGDHRYFIKKNRALAFTGS